ncbi:Ribosomal protein L19/L19e [Corchorus capsularis]|uniref:Ribosomal protein L19/L19e n=1 Tax=Corchorus capsularis TaxID=210143 RepID=A0A1R3GWQ8_COCAP|nr:Ribosomal protein L19/L19e [Corchorus capsularis]
MPLKLEGDCCELVNVGLNNIQETDYVDLYSSVQSEPVEFMSWLLRTLKKKSSIIHECSQIYVFVYKEVALALKINSIYNKRKLLSIHENVRVLHDAFFKYQAKQKLTTQRFFYHEGKRIWGKMKATREERLPTKIHWLRRMRVLRRLFPKYVEPKKTDKHMYHDLLMEARERTLSDQFDAKRAKNKASRGVSRRAGGTPCSVVSQLELSFRAWVFAFPIGAVDQGELLVTLGSYFDFLFFLSVAVVSLLVCLARFPSIRSFFYEGELLVTLLSPFLSLSLARSLSLSLALSLSRSLSLPLSLALALDFLPFGASFMKDEILVTLLPPFLSLRSCSRSRSRSLACSVCVCVSVFSPRIFLWRQGAWNVRNGSCYFEWGMWSTTVSFVCVFSCTFVSAGLASCGGLSSRAPSSVLASPPEEASVFLCTFVCAGLASCGGLCLLGTFVCAGLASCEGLCLLVHLRVCWPRLLRRPLSSRAPSCVLASPPAEASVFSWTFVSAGLASRGGLCLLVDLRVCWPRLLRRPLSSRVPSCLLTSPLLSSRVPSCLLASPHFMSSHVPSCLLASPPAEASCLLIYLRVCRVFVCYLVYHRVCLFSNSMPIRSCKWAAAS